MSEGSLMSDYPNLSKAERLVMNIVWEKGEVLSAEVLEELEGVKDWSRHTVKSYLKQLVSKGLVGIKEISARKYIYYVLISKEAFLADESIHYLKNHYKSLSHMVAGLMKREKVSNQEINELEQLIKEYKGKKDD